MRLAFTKLGIVEKKLQTPPSRIEVFARRLKYMDEFLVRKRRHGEKGGGETNDCRINIRGKKKGSIKLGAERKRIAARESRRRKGTPPAMNVKEVRLNQRRKSRGKYSKPELRGKR